MFVNNIVSWKKYVESADINLDLIFQKDFD